MARRSETSKHPALAVKERDRIMEHDNESLELMLGWDTFTWQMRDFLRIMPFHDSNIDAIRFLGFAEGRKAVSWVQQQREKNPLFSQAVAQRRKITAADISHAYGIDMEVLADFRIHQLLKGEVNATNNEMIAAAKTVYQRNHRDLLEEGMGLARTVIGTFNVHYGPNALPKEPRVIEAEVTEVVTSPDA